VLASNNFRGGEYKHLFVDNKTQLRTNIDPRGLPDGISQHIDKSTHRLYFKNHMERSTSWEDPRQKLAPADRISILRGHRSKWETDQLARSPQEVAALASTAAAAAGGSHRGSSSSSSSSAAAAPARASTTVPSSSTTASPAPLRAQTASSSSSSQNSDLIRLEGYQQLLVGMVFGETISDAQQKILKDVRAKRVITDAEHEAALKRLNKTQDDLDDMCAAGERLEESLSMLRAQGESCVCCMDAPAEYISRWRADERLRAPYCSVARAPHTHTEY
jgi:hypothetical protein